ncbi:MAG: hypothetical protein H0X62_05065 [Bacteroidetes bacterium]|nr:hypothetical protein [Bacteroidota bacterium]
MKFKIEINNTTTIEEVNDYWSTVDYIKLLEKFDYPDAEKASKDTLKELLSMAITDFEPNEAAAIVLEYKLSEELNEGQIHQISNDMLLDKIAEEYPEISLHSTLFHINQLLYKAFNGKFPNTKATLIDCSIKPLEDYGKINFTKEMVLKLLGPGLSDSNLIKRLFTEQMSENKPFEEAENIIWELKNEANQNFKILTSEYWLSVDDLISNDFEAEYIEIEETEEK